MPFLILLSVLVATARAADDFKNGYGEGRAEGGAFGRNPAGGLFGDPIINNRGGRDPKLIRHKPGNHWVIVAYGPSNHFSFYTSTNLKDWTKTSSLNGYYECPELFELPVDGDSGNTRWVIFGADGNYQIGGFDGRQFTPEHEGLRMRMLVDRPMYEVIGGDGARYQTDLRRKDGGKPLGTIAVTAEQGDATIELLEIYEMKSIWKK